MAKLTAQARQAWLEREKRMVLTTMDASNVPNTIWILCAELVEDDKIVIANNSMHKTLENVIRGCQGSLLYIAPEREAYQVKGMLEHHRDGAVYDDMKKWLNPSFPGKSAVLLNIEEVYYGATKVA